MKTRAAALIVATAWTLAAAAVMPARADSETYKADCAKCHARAATLARNLKGATPAEKAEALDAFLVGHHAGDETRRKRIVEYLVGLARR